MINIAAPDIGKKEQQNVMEVLESGILAQGPRVKEFEEKFAEFTGAKHAIATSNGTTALHISLLAAGVKPGDEVITTPFSFIATATSIVFCGAKPVFVDIDPKSFNIDPEKIEAAITPKTKAIMPVHLYGQCADMPRILAVAKKHGLKVVEDAAQAHGAGLDGKKAGAFGDAAGFSFYPTKNMTTGEGGMITTNDDKVADQARLLRNHGQLSRYEHVLVGFNHRMTDIGAAIGLGQLERLDKFNDRRRSNASYLTKGLMGTAGITTPHVIAGAHHVYHQYTVRVKNRDEVAKKMRESGVGCGIYYPTPLHHYEPLKEYGKGPIPEAEAACREVLSLPVHPGLSQDDLDTIVAALKKAVGQ